MFTNPALYFDGAITGAWNALVHVMNVLTGVETDQPITLGNNLTVNGTLTASGAVATGVLQPTGTNTATRGAAVIAVPVIATGVASQLSDLTRDYEVYFDCTTAGTGFSLLIGPTATPANTLINATVASIGVLYRVRLPAGWYLKATWTTAVFAQLAISC